LLIAQLDIVISQSNTLKFPKGTLLE